MADVVGASSFQITVDRNRQQISRTVGEKVKKPSLVLFLKQVKCLIYKMLMHKN